MPNFSICYVIVLRGNQLVQGTQVEGYSLCVYVGMVIVTNTFEHVKFVVNGEALIWEPVPQSGVSFEEAYRVELTYYQ